ncbi:MAG: hypothetical protein U0232_21285 [Thermomicrobiales bacterium]
MRRALLCCLLVLLTACAGRGTPPTATPRPTERLMATATVPQVAAVAAVATVATATRAASPGGARACPDGLPVKGVGAEDGSLRAVVPGDPEYERASWLRCFATVEEAGAAGFVRSAARGTPVAQPGAALAGEDAAVVVRVIDAVTIEVRLGDGRVEVVRYLGVDAPGQCDGAAGLAFNTTLVAGRTVQLEKDVSERDRFERLLRYVWVAGDDGVLRLANAEVVRGGQAVVAMQPPDVVRAAPARRGARGLRGGTRTVGDLRRAAGAARRADRDPRAADAHRHAATADGDPGTARAADRRAADRQPAVPPTATAPPVAPTATQRAATATRVPPSATRPPVVAPKASARRPATRATRRSACRGRPTSIARTSCSGISRCCRPIRTGLMGIRTGSGARPDEGRTGAVDERIWLARRGPRQCGRGHPAAYFSLWGRFELRRGRVAQDGLEPPEDGAAVGWPCLRCLWQDAAAVGVLAGPFEHLASVDLDDVLRMVEHLVLLGGVVRVPPDGTSLGPTVAEKYR